MEPLRIDVSDTGSGLAPDRRPGVGLSSMRERAEELGGSFEAGDRPGGGTVVQEMISGYVLAGRLLRASMVAVSKGGPRATEAGDENV